MLAGQVDQSVAELFFRAYSGSGLVIHCLARFQRIPKRSSVARTVSSLTRSLVNPSARLTSATNSKRARAFMQDFFEPLGLLGSKRRAGVVGTAGLGLQGSQAVGIEGFDHHTYRIIITAQVPFDRNGVEPPCTGQQDLAAAEHKRIGGV